MNNNGGGIIDARVLLQLAGQEYQLLYDAGALIRYAEETGRDAMLDLQRLAKYGIKLQKYERDEGDIPAPLPDGGMVGLTRDLLWAGLIAEQPELKRADVGRLFGMRDVNRVMETVGEGLNRSIGKQVAANPTPAELMPSA